MTTTTGMDLRALRLACAYGLKPTARPRRGKVGP